MAATEARPTRTVVFAAYLVGARNEHRGQGSFAGIDSAYGLYREISTFLGMSPGVCARDDLEVHVVHDVPSVTAEDHRGVRLHKFAPDSSYLGGDRRWGLYLSVLRSLNTTSGGLSCFWALDLDIAAISVPPCSALAPTALHVGSDGCSRSIKLWMHRASERTQLNRTWGAHYQAVLANQSHPVFNSGIIGGRRGIWTSALKAVVERLEQHRTASPAHVRHVVGADMLLWNWAAASWHRQQHGVVTGYPRGPVNFPMWAKLPDSGKGLCPMHPSPDGQRPCGSQCAYHWLNSSGLGAYWFGHKLPRSWLNMLRLHACFPQAAVTARGTEMLERVGSGKLRCECLKVGQALTHMNLV